MSIFKLPDLGEGLPDAEIVRWLVEPGETVKIDQPVVEMETAKAVVEVPAPQNGVIETLHGNAGDVIPVGDPLFSFAASDATETPEKLKKKTQSSKKADKPAQKNEDAGTVVGNVVVGDEVTTEAIAATSSGLQASPVVKALAKKLKVDLNQIQTKNGVITQQDVKNANIKQAAKNGVKAAPQQSNPNGFRASPAVRAHANRLQVNLADCTPTGHKQTICKSDVENVANSSGINSGATNSGKTAVAANIPLPTVNHQVIPLRGNRRAMAQAMTLSKNNVVPVTLTDEVQLNWQGKQDITLRIIRALIKACKLEPVLNSWLGEENGALSRIQHPVVNLGIAVDAEDGLYVPVIPNACQLSLSDVRSKINEYRDAIQTKQIAPAAFKDATITLSNFGTIAGRFGSPIVVPPQVAIVGIGRLFMTAKLDENGLRNVKTLPVSLTFDHRAATGGEAARFLRVVLEDLALAN